jgi:hypothetical protein
VAGSSLPVLWICGPSGVGKSTVGWELYQQTLSSFGVRGAYVDLDQISFCRPEPDDDADNHRVKAANLGAMWSNFRSRGARFLVITGIVDAHDTIAAYRKVLGESAMTVCRLRVNAQELRERVFLRGAGIGPPLAGDGLKGRPHEYLSRFADLSADNAKEIEAAGIGDFCVDTDRRSVGDVVEAVRAAARPWPGL